jgi:ParB family chromosome partitioning protein
MILLPQELRFALRANAIAQAASAAREARFDPAPVVKFFNPMDAATWLATELGEDEDTMFGLADLGFGCPELGYFRFAKSQACICRSACASSETSAFSPPIRFPNGRRRRAGPARSSPPRRSCASRPDPQSRADARPARGARPPQFRAGPRPARPGLHPRSKTMNLAFIDHDRLTPARVNMRFAKAPPDVADLLPSIRARGILVPLIVRAVAGTPDAHEIVAGLRRWTADGIARGEGIDHGPVPCAILDAGDDADAIEASLIENVARRDPDEVTQWATFVRLVKEGRDPEAIGLTFGMAEAKVRRILALGNLLPRIRSLYAAREIDVPTIRHLTMASKAQQKDWLALLDDPQARAPTGHQLRSWLLGGQSIKVAHALFPLDAYKGAIVSDLFGEDRYFADGDAFWALQNDAIAARAEAFRTAGWSDVLVMPRDQSFNGWEHEKTAKRKGGRVYIEIRASGEVTVHEGYVTRKEAQAAARGGAESAMAKAARPEASGPLNTYIDLHRHAAVRAALTGHPGVALRLMVAHAIAGSTLWRVDPEPQATRHDTIRESVASSPGEALFGERRRAVLALLGLDLERTALVQRFGDTADLPGLLARLLALPDAAVLDVIAIVMGESLTSGGIGVEAAGGACRVNMADWWAADDALLDLVRDKPVMEAMVAEVAGDLVARANAGQKTATLRRIIGDHLAGDEGRERMTGWVPRWMKFPPSAYTGRGGVGSVEAHAAVQAAQFPALEDDAPERIAA